MRKNPVQLFSVYVMLLVFLFGNFGAFIIHDISKTQNRNNMLSRLADRNDNGLITLEIPLHELSNKDVFQQQDEDEIIYKGCLYDVERKVIKNGSIVFYCIHDKMEEDLNTQLNDHSKALFDQPPSCKTTTKSFSKNDFRDYLPIAFIVLTNSDNNASFSYCRHLMPQYGDVSHEIFSPPPSLV